MKKIKIAICLAIFALLTMGLIVQAVDASYSVPSGGSLVAWFNLDTIPSTDSIKNIQAKNYGYFPTDPILEPGIIKNSSYFNGNSSLEFADSDNYSIGKNGMTVSLWIKPETFAFKGEGDGYVHFLGKQEWNTAPNYEWVFRLYNDRAWDSVSRSKRISFYVFNLTGGLGVGSYFQDDLKEDEWVHVVGVANGTHILIYKNGVLRDKDAYKPGLNGFVDIIPKNGNAPVRIGSADRESSFQGNLDEVMIFSRALSSEEIKKLYDSFFNQEQAPLNYTNLIKPIDLYPNSQEVKALRITNDSKNLILQGLGTGTIQINDLLKLTPMSKAPLCSREIEGTIYYDAVKKKYFGCDGTSWKAFY